LYNYTKKGLDKIAAQTGFIRDNLEKIFRLNDVLQFLYAGSTNGEYLSLKGGTAINLTVFNMPRLSVDIDDESKIIRWQSGKQNNYILTNVSHLITR